MKTNNMAKQIKLTKKEIYYFEELIYKDASSEKDDILFKKKNKTLEDIKELKKVIQWHLNYGSCFLSKKYIKHFISIGYKMRKDYYSLN